MLRREIGLDTGERFRRLALEHAFGRVIAGQRMAGEIIGSGIAHVLDDSGRDVAQIDKARGQAPSRRGRQSEGNRQQRGGEAAFHGGQHITCAFRAIALLPPARHHTRA